MQKSEDSKTDLKHQNESYTDKSGFMSRAKNALSPRFGSSAAQKPDGGISEREKLELEIKQRAEQRRLRMEQEEMEDRKRRQVYEDEMAGAEIRREEERRDFDTAYETSTRKAEQERVRMERASARHLEEHKIKLESVSREELETLKAHQEQQNQRMLQLLKTKEEDRLRSAELQNQEIERIREETQRKIENYTREQKETRARQAREEAKLEAELQKMEAENREARERQKQVWEDRLKKMKEQYDYMMKVMAHRQWTMTMERNFDSRLNFYRSAGKNIRRKFERLAQSLITFKKHLRKSENPDNIHFRPVTLQAEELRNVIQKQKEVLTAEISNLEDMHKEAGWPFLVDIRESLKDVLLGCDNFLDELDANFRTQLNKTGKALRQMNFLYDQLSKSYSQIPTMDSLKNKHGKQGGREGEEGSSSSQKKEEHQTDEGHVFYIEEPED